MTDENAPATELLLRAAEGDADALRQALTTHRERLKRMVRLRLNRRLRGRVDESDIVQDALLDASRRLRDYVSDPSTPFFLWLRDIAGRKLTDVHRRHLGAGKRDAALEVPLDCGAYPLASSAALAARLLGRFTSPSHATTRAELQMRVREALDTLDPLDREVLALRHYEQLSTIEVARVLGIGKSAASSRYLRALKKIKNLLTDESGRQVD